MKVYSPCPACGHADRATFTTFYAIPYYEDRSAVFECPKGHKYAVLLQAQRFEVLLESGARALANDFTSEAVMSSYTGLERFYEFGSRVFFEARGHKPAYFETMFKCMANQSERQIGAFVALYALEMGESYAPNEKIATFRNRVIHKGLIPNPDEALDFCRMVYAEIYRVASALRARFAEAMQMVVTRELHERFLAQPKGLLTSTISGCGIYNLSYAVNPDTFDEAYKHFLASLEIETFVRGPQQPGA